MELKLFCLRHRATGALMPEMRHGRGYARWSPGAPDGRPRAALDRPRLLHSEDAARDARAQWARGPDDEPGAAASRHAEDLDIVELAAVDARAYRKVGSVAVRHAPGPQRRYSLHNGTLDELDDGVFELYARAP